MSPARADPAPPAQTHPRRYLLHKYWSRKPHNVIRHHLERLVPPGGVVVDPFCGSGVVLCEAAGLGLTAYGFDVNPIAVLLSRVTAAPPPAARFSRALAPLVEVLQAAAAEVYVSTSGMAIRHVVHALVVHCARCGQACAANGAQRAGRRYACPHCENPLRFNMETRVGTRVTGVVFENGPEVVTDAGLLCEQEMRSERTWGRVRGDYAATMPENPRTLTFDGLLTTDFFTARNLSLVGSFADAVHGIEDEASRAAGLVLLTSGVAQCSRLIAYRDNLTGGGPAWTVPGFWVPPVHLEANPGRHYGARLERFVRAWEDVPSPRAPVRVECRDAVDGLAALAAQGVRADLVFFDPPYGDSVPFAEFSAIWNGFLGRAVDYDADLSVSNRIGAGGGWAQYTEGLGRAAEAAAGILKDRGRLLVTFNNKDLRAWRALLRALQEAGFRCEDVRYQAPAVVSAKAQFSPAGSYVGDLVAVCGKTRGRVPTRDLAPVAAELAGAVARHEGAPPKALLLRALALAWLRHDVSHDLLGEADNLIDGVLQA